MEADNFAIDSSSNWFCFNSQFKRTEKNLLKKASMKIPSFPTLNWSASLKSSRGGYSSS